MFSFRMVSITFWMGTNTKKFMKWVESKETKKKTICRIQDIVNVWNIQSIKAKNFGSYDEKRVIYETECLAHSTLNYIFPVIFFFFAACSLKLLKILYLCLNALWFVLAFLVVFSWYHFLFLPLFRVGLGKYSRCASFKAKMSNKRYFNSHYNRWIVELVFKDCQIQQFSICKHLFNWQLQPNRKWQNDTKE